MKRREEWQPILEREIRQWGVKSYAELSSELSDEQCYEIEWEGKRYQVEVQLLKILDVGIAVDDGSIPASVHPLNSNFICKKIKEISGN